MTIENKKTKVLDGNEAVARVSYALSEIIAIYPITPSTTMAEIADENASFGLKNIWGDVPKVIEMQSEGGAIGAMHGALQAGSLSTTYTSSQGLLLMIPNMYKIAGELTPAVIHVAARALATHALSIFGDHSDVMAAQGTGWAMLASSSVQEAQDMALIAHASTLASRIPFMHFFEGFRVSHEVSKIDMISEDDMRAMIDEDFIRAHRERALNPENPFIRGTSQNPDVYFQGLESRNTFYNCVPNIIASYMEKFAGITGRKYNLVDYYGDTNAERVVVVMGSGAVTVRETIKHLQKSGEKVGVIQVRLFRPFPSLEFLSVLPATVKSIAVLDRVKDSGAGGEPLYKSVMVSLSEAIMSGKLKALPKVIGGRYGLASKEFTPAMAKAVFDEIKKDSSKNNFTVGISDDVTHSSLDYDLDFNLPYSDMVQALFYGLGADGTVGANKNTIKIIGEETDLFAQGYFVYDSKKSGSQTVSHLRFGALPINAPYLVTQANFVACHQFQFIDKTDVLEHAEQDAIFLLNSPFGADAVWARLPCFMQEQIVAKNIKFYVIDAYKVARENGMGGRINTIMQTCFFALSNVLPQEVAIAKIKGAIEKTYKKKGEEVVKKNFAAVDATLANLMLVQSGSISLKEKCTQKNIISDEAPSFARDVIAKIMAGKGDDLPVSAFPVDGTYPSATTKWEKRNVSDRVSCWNPELCIQCGNCSFVCPHAVIRVKNYPSSLLEKAPEGFKSAKLIDKKFGDERCYSLQVYLEDCTGCNLCNVVCPGVNKANPKEKAVMLKDKDSILETERKNIEFFETIPYNDRRDFDANMPRQVQYLEPLFEFSGACAGCGETPYVKLLSQLFGDRMLIANATGCSSIYGGNLPTTPWAKNSEGKGPAWSNSLFEDNAEFGLGFRLSSDFASRQAMQLVKNMQDEIGNDLASAICDAINLSDDKSIKAQRERVILLKQKLQGKKDIISQRLLSLADYLVAKSVWILGGDGWAYDIDYGGLDHVLSCGYKVNTLVLDTGVYSNTGGQASKATPKGAIAKFATLGKNSARKDLGLMMMAYKNIYVAQVSFGADMRQTLLAIKEAERFSGSSLIIAYSHCIAHGIEMEKGIEQQKLAVKTGYWPLYRYNPERIAQGLNPLQIDSALPSVDLKEYLYNEPRFSALIKKHPELAEEFLQSAKKDIESSWNLYKKMAE